MKKVTFGAKPQASNHLRSPDAWVGDRQAAEPMKRFTIDVPLALHKRIKSRCALRGVKMADMLRELLETQFPEEYEQRAGGSEPASN